MRSRALFAALLATLAAWIAAPSVTAQADAQKIRVALLPVAVHTSNTDTGYLSSGIADMLSSRLERSSRVSVRRVSDPERATTDYPRPCASRAKSTRTSFSSAPSLNSVPERASISAVRRFPL